MTEPPGYEFVEGATSDVTFVARGAGAGALFANAAAALLAVTVEDPAGVRPLRTLELALEEPDLELLLLRFLDELIYRRDAEGLLLRAERLQVSPGPPARLAGALVGEPLDPARHRPGSEVKAATAHGLRVARRDGGWEARVTLDV